MVYLHFFVRFGPLVGVEVGPEVQGASNGVHALGRALRVVVVSVSPTLHDVDLSGCRPLDVHVQSGQHPDGWEGYRDPHGSKPGKTDPKRGYLLGQGFTDMKI